MEQLLSLRVPRGISRRLVAVENLLQNGGATDRERSSLPQRDRIGIDADLMAELLPAPAESQPFVAKVSTAQKVSVHADV
ncbi:MAG TPA: hypothetical protein VF980_11270 [Thermoanaerobaculia bacterium]